MSDTEAGPPLTALSTLPHHGVEGSGVDINPVRIVAVFPGQPDGPVRTVSQLEEPQVKPQGGAEEEGEGEVEEG